METRLLAVFTLGLGSVNVSGLCRELGVSRQTFYKYRRRFLAEGPAGLVERSRRPLSSPGRVSAGLEDEIVRVRKQLAEAGVDYGADAVRAGLVAGGWDQVPSTATIHRWLVRRGMVVPAPEKRPRSAGCRFEWPRPNDAWQIDATRWVLSDATEVWVMDILDDHSRLVTAARAYPSPSGEAAWDSFCRAVERWGLPAHVMSDNGSCFTSRLSRLGGETRFEESLRTLGIRHIPSSPAHPQTCGKLERFHQTLKKWLRAHPLAATLDELNHQLDQFCDYYNHTRPHRGIGGVNPSQRWNAQPRAVPDQPIPALPDARLFKVDRQGRISYGRFQIQVGYRLAGHTVLAISNGDDIAVFSDSTLIRRLTLDRSRRYQPNHQPPGRKPRIIGPCN